MVEDWHAACWVYIQQNSVKNVNEQCHMAYSG